MGGTTLIYRRGNLADAVRLAAFAERCFTATYAAHNTPEDMRDYIAAAYGAMQQERELADPDWATVLAESDEGLVGYAQFRRSSPAAPVILEAPVEIYRFYVDASAHGSGVAQRLMANAIEAARDLGGRHVWLGVWERNARAIAFYRKSGFRDMGTQVFQLGSDPQTDRVLAKPLILL